MSRVVEQESDYCSIALVNGDTATGSATIWASNFGCQAFFNLFACCMDADGTGIKISMAMCLPLRLATCLIGFALALVVEVLYVIFCWPASLCNDDFQSCACEGWGMRAIWRRDAKRQVRSTRRRNGSTETYWKTVATWNVWNRSGPWQEFDCCSLKCCHAVFCMASWQGTLASMGCDCKDDIETGRDRDNKQTEMMAAGSPGNDAKAEIKTPQTLNVQSDASGASKGATPKSMYSDQPPPAYDAQHSPMPSAPGGAEFHGQSPKEANFGVQPALVRLGSAIGIPQRKVSYFAENDLANPE